jgi:polysaccharide pyruvyl transferase WcaK-like protein
MESMRIGLITTLGRNIGDAFIRDGIVQVLAHVFGGRDVRFVAVDKHRPFTVYPSWHPLRWLQTLDRLPRGRRAAQAAKAEISGSLHRFGGSRFDDADLIVQCGAPVMWPGCHRCEWAGPLWDQVVGRLSSRVPVLNLAAGSAYPWERPPNGVTDPQDSSYLKRILGYCRVTTVRDDLAARLVQSLGASAKAIPCSAFLVGRRFDTPALHDDGVVLFNYMPGGGHFDWGQPIDDSAWMATVHSLIDRVSRRHPVAFICHDATEYAAAKQLKPDVPRFLPTSIESYFSLIGRSKAAICNRLHASVALAGLGIPSISIGTDTRLLMVAALGLPYQYVVSADQNDLEATLESLLDRRADERERLLDLREWTWNRYVADVTKGVRS